MASPGHKGLAISSWAEPPPYPAGGMGIFQLDGWMGPSSTIHTLAEVFLGPPSQVEILKNSTGPTYGPHPQRDGKNSLTLGPPQSTLPHMPPDPRHAASLEEAAENADGTFNGIRALSWLSEVLNPGKGVSEEEVRKIADKVILDKKNARP